MHYNVQTYIHTFPADISPLNLVHSIVRSELALRTSFNSLQTHNTFLQYNLYKKNQVNYCTTEINYIEYDS